MTTITGLTIQAEFGTSETVANLEVIIDSAIDTVNSDAYTSIGYMTGTAGSKTITVTGAQAAAIKPLIAMKLASNIVSSGNSSSFSLNGLSQSNSSSTGANNANSELYRNAIQRLIGRSFVRTK